EAPERVEDGEEHLLGDVLGLGRVSQALQREAVDAREVGLVEEFEMSRAALEDLLDELPVVGPGLLTMRHVLLSCVRPAGAAPRVGSVREARISGDTPVDRARRGTPAGRLVPASLPLGGGSSCEDRALQKWGPKSRTLGEQAACHVRGARQCECSTHEPHKENRCPPKGTDLPTARSREEKLSPSVDDSFLHTEGISLTVGPRARACPGRS